jgi:hypothetical protein
VNDGELFGRNLRPDELWKAFCCHTADASVHADVAGALVGSPEDARRRLHAARAALGSAERTLDEIQFGVRT